ncbi:MAG: hypothetical protein KDA42_11430 [Planctomycetales bacterium]|nr:hypothetical protein [Planctomycetales bacterium]
MIHRVSTPPSADRAMLIPNFSLRAIFALTGGAAFLALCVHLALRGQHWAGGVAAALIGGLAVLIVGAIVFLPFLWLGQSKMRLAKPNLAAPTPATHVKVQAPGEETE